MPAVDFKDCKLVSNNKGTSRGHTVYYPVDSCAKQQAAVLQNQIGHFQLCLLPSFSSQSWIHYLLCPVCSASVACFRWHERFFLIYLIRTHHLLLRHSRAKTISADFYRRWNTSARATTEALCPLLDLAPKLWPTSTTTPLVSTLQTTSRTSTQLWMKLKRWPQLVRPTASKMSPLSHHCRPVQVQTDAGSVNCILQ